MYNLEISEEAHKKFSKLKKKNIKQLMIINKKILQIQKDPLHFKPLKGNMKGIRSVHIDKSFVLTYEIIETEKTIRVIDYAHHDTIYF